ASACHVEILVRGAAMRQVVTREGVNEHAVNPLRLENVQQFPKVPSLLVLVTRVFALEPDWPCTLPLENVAAVAQIGRAAVSGAPDLSDCHRLPLCPALGDKGADVVAEARRHLRSTIAGVRRDNIEWLPINALEGKRGIAQFSTEPGAGHLDRLAQQ